MWISRGDMSDANLPEPGSQQFDGNNAVSRRCSQRENANLNCWTSWIMATYRSKALCQGASMESNSCLDACLDGLHGASDVNHLSKSRKLATLLGQGCDWKC